MIPTSVISHTDPGMAGNGHDFHWLADALPDQVELLDGQCRRLYLNPACSQFFSNPEQMLGTSPADDPGMQDADDIRAMLTGVLHSGIPDSRQYKRLLVHGARRWFECKAIAFSPAGRQGDGPALILISREVGRQGQLEQLLNEYRLRLKLVQQTGELGSWEYDFRSETLLMSEKFAGIFGLPPQTTSMDRATVFAMIHPEDRERLYKLRNEMDARGQVYEIQYRIVRPDQQTRVLHSRWCLEMDEVNLLNRAIGFCEDITDRAAAEKTTLAPEEHFHFLAVNAQDTAIFLLDLEGRVMSWNPGAEKLYGYHSAEILNHDYSVFLVPGMDDSNLSSGWLESATLTGRLEIQDWRVRKDGDRFLAQITMMPFFDKAGVHIGYMKLTHDLTKQHCMEDMLRSQADRLKANARRLVELQESERQHLARELHDLVGPKLTALGINLQLISSRIPKESNNSMAEVLRESVDYVHGTVDVLRYIIGELRPHALDDYGLRAALRSHVAQFMRLTGIRVNVKESSDTGQVPDLIKMSLFRITQEALNNIVRHSQATAVDIAISYTNNSIGLSISDNGIGFDQNSVDPNPLSQSYGLSIMRERAEAIGANFRLETAAGEGVTIHVECRI